MKKINSQWLHCASWTGQHRRVTSSRRLGSSCCDLQANRPSKHSTDRARLREKKKKMLHSVSLPDESNEDNLSTSQRHSHVILISTHPLSGRETRHLPVDPREIARWKASSCLPVDLSLWSRDTVLFRFKYLTDRLAWRCWNQPSPLMSSVPHCIWRWKAYGVIFFSESVNLEYSYGFPFQDKAHTYKGLYKEPYQDQGKRGKELREEWNKSKLCMWQIYFFRRQMSRF